MALENYQSCEEVYKKQYQRVIDNILNALNSRFRQSIFPVLCGVEEFLMAVTNGSHITYDNNFFFEIEDFIVDDIDHERLKHECPMVADFCRIVLREKQVEVFKITKISTTMDLMNE